MDLTIKQVAEQLRVSTKTIYRRIHSGELRAQYIASNCIRIEESDLAKYRESVKQRKTYTHA
jgi:excisionase family DNA binding protein